MNLAIRSINNDKTTNFKGIRELKISSFSKNAIKVIEQIIPSSKFNFVSSRDRFDVDLVMDTSSLKAMLKNTLKCNFVNHNDDIVGSFSMPLGAFVKRKNISKLKDNFEKGLQIKITELVKDNKINTTPYPTVF